MCTRNTPLCGERYKKDRGRSQVERKGEHRKPRNKQHSSFSAPCIIETLLQLPVAGLQITVIFQPQTSSAQVFKEARYHLKMAHLGR